MALNKYMFRTVTLERNAAITRKFCLDLFD